MITGMNHITLAVADIDKSFEFYTKILGLKPLVKWDKGAYFAIGDFWFCLNVDVNRKPNPCYTHYAFSVSKGDFAALSAQIISSGTVIFKENTSPGESLYFLDPDGHKLELHVSNVDERLQIKKQNLGNWKQVQWFV